MGLGAKWEELMFQEGMLLLRTGTRGRMGWGICNIISSYLEKLINKGMVSIFKELLHIG